MCHKVTRPEETGRLQQMTSASSVFRVRGGESASPTIFSLLVNSAGTIAGVGAPRWLKFKIKRSAPHLLRPTVTGRFKASSIISEMTANHDTKGLKTTSHCAVSSK